MRLRSVIRSFVQVWAPHTRYDLTAHCLRWHLKAQGLGRGCPVASNHFAGSGRAPAVGWHSTNIADVVH